MHGGDARTIPFGVRNTQTAERTLSDCVIPAISKRDMQNSRRFESKTQNAVENTERLWGKNTGVKNGCVSENATVMPNPPRSGVSDPANLAAPSQIRSILTTTMQRAPLGAGYVPGAISPSVISRTTRCGYSNSTTIWAGGADAT